MKLISPTVSPRASLTLFVAGALTFTPLMVPTAAQAAPSLSEIWDNAINYGRNVTVSGVVTKDRMGNDFFMKGDDGNGYLVVMKNQPAGIYTGVRVHVTGTYDGNELSASRVTVEGNSTSNTGARYMTVNGQVTKDPAGDTFFMRSDEGQSYLVITNDQSSNISSGVRVTVAGWFDGNHLNANTVKVLGRGNWVNNSIGRNVTTTGVVTKDKIGNDFFMKSDDGQGYLVVSRNQPEGVYPGVRVRVIGSFDGNVLNATSVKAEGDSIGDGNNARYVTVNGVVTRDNYGNTFVIRSDNGDGYLVSSRNQPPGVRKGVRVKVGGYYDTYQINANKIDIVNNAGGVDDFGPANMNVSGIITRIGSPYRFDVRADNGRNYSVNSVEPISNRTDVGDKVSLVGQNLGNDIVRAVRVTVNGRPGTGAASSVRPQDDTVSFWGRVKTTNTNNGKAVIIMVADNGITYSVRYSTNTEYKAGQRLRVSGKLKDNIVYATTVSTR